VLTRLTCITYSSQRIRNQAYSCRSPGGETKSPVASEVVGGAGGSRHLDMTVPGVSPRPNGEHLWNKVVLLQFFVDFER
jgi:hypothetical protein